MSPNPSLLAEFGTAGQFLDAIGRTRAAGYRRIGAYAPFAVPGLDEALDLPASRLPQWMLIFGIFGGASAFLLQAYLAAVDFPLNAGGRPYFSWPSFTLVTFEFTVLGAALAGFFGMLALNGLPRPYHPIFDATNFDRASQDRFFLMIDSDDPEFDPYSTRRFLDSLNPIAVTEVNREAG
ncbi:MULTISPECIES: DUF3341 domain-containing protein [unclassified Methylocaldum]|jgi:hypothetical protein|uniref:DUF3341 domain-containing protein n=1 Tax=unclassified Methylocaldum TaxID=2622260 RepID=UPI0012EB4848|nr:DUF3341 domain-containing protein [Methylocaldum sp. RMAD-M]MBP1151840.1 hypothetical protein [Methylocaldum sp. RMAD-M]MVF23941.1 DUF3341 domain-containing protein [Methylocaldum sp. BRCS4]